MGLNVKPLPEDIVDSLTHFWAVAFFLFLSFLLLVVPGNNHNTQQTILPQYDASCWCPAQFEASQVAYTNTICSGAFNSLLRGENYSYASLVKPFSGPLPPGPQNDGLNFLKPVNKNKNNSSDDGGDDEIQASQTKGSVKLNSPVFLLALALALRLPHILTSMAAMCCSGSANLGQTLEAAKKAEVITSTGSRRKFYSDLVMVFKDQTKHGKKTCSCLYMMMKILMIIVIIAEIVIVNNHILPELEGETTKPEGENIMASSSSSSSSSSSLTADEIEMSGPSVLYHCFFNIRRMNDIHKYSVQCHFKNGQLPQPDDSISNSNSEPMSISNSMLSTNVFLMVLVSLVLLVFVNVLNTLVWLVNLARDSTRTRLGLDKTAPLDLVLFSLMARTHLSMGLVVGLSKCNNTSTVDDEIPGVDGDQPLQKL